MNYNGGEPIGQDPAWLKIISEIKDLSPEVDAVLILGETGTGKDVIARFLHDVGNGSKPFIPINCAALSESLIESELFGHKKGAFTDAKADKKGKFELANGGTLFLDEVGAMPLKLQAKLLRVVQDREVTPIGSSEPVKINTRILYATNRNLNEAVEKGEFRQDLYYRLDVIKLNLPALRDRGEDILLLAEHFTSFFCKKHKKPIQHLSTGTKKQLLDHIWPGNVRELENTINRSVLSSSGEELVLSSNWEDVGYKFVKVEETDRNKNAFSENLSNRNQDKGSPADWYTLCEKLHSHEKKEHPKVNIQLRNICSGISPDLWTKGTKNLGMKLFSFLLNDETGILSKFDQEKIFDWFKGDANFVNFYNKTSYNVVNSIRLRNKQRGREHSEGRIDTSRNSTTPHFLLKDKNVTNNVLPKEMKY